MSAIARHGPVQQWAQDLNHRAPAPAAACPSCHDPQQIGNAALLEQLGGLGGVLRAGGDDELSLLGFEAASGVHSTPSQNTRVGTRLGAHALKADLPIDDVAVLEGCNLETTLLSASAQGTVGTDGLSLGMNAELMGAALACDKPSAAQVDRNLIRLGFSEGVGLGARLHWSDEDGDCNPEYGVGLDLGPFTMDQKSEAPFPWLLGEPTGCGK